MNPERLLLAAIMLIAGGLRLWGLEQNGWGAEYYSAAVFSMGQSWHNFLFAAFDPAGFIAVDKPPLALWLQVLSTRLLGFSPFALMLPQVLCGVASVAVLWAILRPRAGLLAAATGALLLAAMPVWVAVNRTNNTDTALVLVLLLAAWSLLIAVETGDRRRWLLASALIGLSFNIKMLAGFVVLPVFLLTWLVFAPVGWRRRLVDALLAGVVLTVVSTPWVLLVELTPPGQRPYVGSSRHDSMLELVFGHNASRRFAFDRDGVGRVPSEADGQGAQPSTPGRTADAEPTPPMPAGDPRADARALIVRTFVRSPAGPLRLASGQLAAQFGWWLPIALAGALLSLRGVSSARTDAAGESTAAASATGASAGRSARAFAFFWCGWIAVCWLVYAHLGGILHYYYTATLAPAVAALAGVGVAALWRLYTRARAGLRAAGPPLLLVVCVVWQLQIHLSALGVPLSASLGWLWAPPDAWLWMLHATVVSTVAASVGWLLALTRGGRQAATAAGGGAPGVARGRPVAAMLAFGLGLGGLMVLPVAWALSSVLLPAQGLMPSADLYRLMLASRSPAVIAATRFGRSADVERLVAYLSRHGGDARYLFASTATWLAAPVIIASGRPVMARGGFHGLDAPLSVDAFAQRVATGEVRFAMVGDLTTASRRLGGESATRPIDDWIRQHGRPVPAELWRGAGMRRDIQLYALTAGAPGAD